MGVASWFYDNRVPAQVQGELAIHPNGFHQCSTKLTSQKAAWGTHGAILRPIIPGIPNTDPNRSPHEVGEQAENCNKVPMKYTLNRMDITNSYYYLPPGLEIETAKQIQRGAAAPLTIKKQE